MTLSNTAVPRYYGAFRDSVLRGEIPVNREVSMEMNRIDSLIRDPNFYYDSEAVEGFVAYCEDELTLTDGSDLHMLDTFKLWAEQIFGWYYFVERTVYDPDLESDQIVFEFKQGQRKAQARGGFTKKLIKKRLTTKQYLDRGPRCSEVHVCRICIHAFFLNIDTATTHQINTSPTMKQAEEVLSPFRTSITRARGPLFKFLTEGTVRRIPLVRQPCVRSWLPPRRASRIS
jgi:hypothetical protein